VSNPIITTPRILGHGDRSTPLGSDEVVQQVLIHANLNWVHAFAASEVVTGQCFSPFAIPHGLLSDQFEGGIAVDFTHTNGAVFLGVDVAKSLMKLHISAGLGPLVRASSVVGKGAHGSIKLGKLWDFAVGFEHANVQT